MVRRNEGGGVQNDVPATLLSRLYPLERVLHTGEVRLCGVGEEPVRGAPREFI